jgi:hypothetical protein
MNFIQITPNDIILNKTLNALLDKYADILTSKMKDLVKRRKNVIIRRTVYGSAKYRAHYLGMVGSELFKRSLDPEVQGMIGFTKRYNIHKKLEQSLLLSLRLEVSRFNPKNVFTKVFLRYNIMKKATPHPAKTRRDGRNIKVKSWLDWLHGEITVREARFVSLERLTKAANSKNKAKKSKTTKVKDGSSKGPMKAKRKKKRMALPRSYPRVGRKSGYMFDSGKDWKMPNPLSYGWITERSLLIGSDMLDYYEVLIYAANNKAMKVITPSQFSKSF